MAQLIYDITVRFCDRYVEKRSRTHDQMVQAARSGVQNIAEGSQASGTSKKTELKLTNVARASLEELRLDYEDFLRQRGLPIWNRDDPRRQALIDRRCATVDEVAAWVREENDRGRRGQRGHGPKLPVPPTKSASNEIAANAALVLLAVACSLLDRSSPHRLRRLKPRAASPSASTAYVPENGHRPLGLPSPPRPPMIERTERYRTPVKT